jgi:glucosylceramidase
MIPSGQAKAQPHRYFWLALAAVVVVMLFLPFFQVKTLRAEVSAWLTTADGTNKLTLQPLIYFSSERSNFLTTFDINEHQRLQQIDGFGAAMTDTSAWLIGVKMDQEQRDRLMHALFDPLNGLGMSVVHIPMGASDFTASGVYSYDDITHDQKDPRLQKFSIAHDTAYIIPLLKQAMQLNPYVKYMATPWSPPAWMKTNASMLGTSNSQTGYLTASAYQPLAGYFVKFLQAYKERGIPLYAITPQNEPFSPVETFPGMSFPALNEDSFIKNNLGPALKNANLAPKILIYNQNWDRPDYPLEILNDPTAQRYVAGTAWHCYGGDPSIMTKIHYAYPSKDMYVTECSTGQGGIAPLSAIELLLRSTQNWAKAVVLWNIALDTSGGPKIGEGCGNCTGLVAINQSTGQYTYTENYYQLGHLSKFVVPGAYHIASTITRGIFPYESPLEAVAFQNPDDSKVVIVYNPSSWSDTFKIRWNTDHSFIYTLPSKGIVTFKWAGKLPSPLITTMWGYKDNTLWFRLIGWFLSLLALVASLFSIHQHRDPYPLNQRFTFRGEYFSVQARSPPALEACPASSGVRR